MKIYEQRKEKDHLLATTFNLEKNSWSKTKSQYRKFEKFEKTNDKVIKRIEQKLCRNSKQEAI